MINCLQRIPYTKSRTTFNKSELYALSERNARQLTKAQQDPSHVIPIGRPSLPPASLVSWRPISGTLHEPPTVLPEQATSLVRYAMRQYVSNVTFIPRIQTAVVRMVGPIELRVCLSSISHEPVYPRCRLVLELLSCLFLIHSSLHSARDPAFCEQACTKPNYHSTKPRLLHHQPPLPSTPNSSRLFSSRRYGRSRLLLRLGPRQT